MCNRCILFSCNDLCGINDTIIRKGKGSSLLKCTTTKRCPDITALDNSAQNINLSAICFHRSLFNFSNIFSSIPISFQLYVFIEFTSVSANIFSSNPLPFRQYFSSIPLSYQQYSSIFNNILLIDPASNSAILFHQSRFHFSNIFSSIPLPFHKYFFSNPASISEFFHQFHFHVSDIYLSSYMLLIMWI